MADFDAKSIVDRSRAAFNAGKCKSLATRLEHLKNLYRMIDEHEKDFCDAMKRDLNKPYTECMGYEITLAKNEIIGYLENLSQWVKPERVKKPLFMLGQDAYIRREPLGVVLIIGAWNYPFQLTIHPLIGAIAAGNTVIIKPSELAEETAKILADLLPKYLDSDCVQVVNGAVKETTALLEQKFDHILYTGNSVVGKIVMAAAAKHLTPVTLELGGKSPVFVDKNCDISTAARRITWGKFVNSGQTCIAPDYILCEEEVKDQLVQAIKDTLKEFYGEDPQKSNDYGRIINERHFKRLEDLLQGVNVAAGGKTVIDDKYIEPTIVTDVKGDEAVMQHEIFGPILPIMIVKDADDAIRYINSRAKCLALYVFSTDKNIVDKIQHDTTSGAYSVNDTLMYGAIDTLPFGGVGTSGMGAYHGKHTFETFSHRRACVVAKLGMEAANQIRYPPYSEKKYSWAQWLMAKKPKREGILGFWPFTLLAMIFAAFFAKKVMRRGRGDSGDRPSIRSSL
ncbi:aldehyde dehydrogenase family 3 member A2-like isoform X1 [Amphiura filiformis]|uniref:aldehyde dehydrogenase family 3 member A2-like isoform X1 n=1 Tax=Amphiura filiformis TaxID=82378 RepID=UPI003B2248F6